MALSAWLQWQMIAVTSPGAALRTGAPWDTGDGMRLVAAPLVPPIGNLPGALSPALALAQRFALTKKTLGWTPCRFVGTTLPLPRIRSTTSRDTRPPLRNTKRLT